VDVALSDARMCISVSCQVRSIINALKLGIKVMMLDMDTNPHTKALFPDEALPDADLVYATAQIAEHLQHELQFCVRPVVLVSRLLCMCVYVCVCYSNLGYSFMYTYSKPVPSVIGMWQHVYDETMRGGWDQSQYGYWAQNMSDVIKIQGIGRAYVPRWQNDFENIEQRRIAAARSRSTEGY
jgi:hypothetical protein